MLPALAGLAVGLAYAAISVYWAVGGRWLLNTVGISLSQPGQAGHLAALLAVWGAAAVKAVAAVLPLLAIGVWPRTANGGLRRLARVLTWIEAAILVGYGLVLTASGLLVQAGVIEAAAHADRLALKWHAYLWDPWFLIWGIFVFLALWRSRPASQDHLPGLHPGSAGVQHHAGEQLKLAGRGRGAYEDELVARRPTRTRRLAIAPRPRTGSSSAPSCRDTGRRRRDRRRMAEIQAAREASQPIRARTGGSTFANPPGHKAWELIDRAGCRGLRRGDAQISEKHTNFLINAGAASAADIEGLGEEVRRRVFEQTGIDARLGDQAGSAALFPAWKRSRHEAKDRRIADGRLVGRARGSLSSGKECAAALARSGYGCARSTSTRDLRPSPRRSKPRPDVIFNALHGRGGEDGTVQGLLEILQIPYTHSGVLASAVAMNKPMAKAVFAAAGLPVAEGVVVTREAMLIQARPDAGAVRRQADQRGLERRRAHRAAQRNSWREEVAQLEVAEALVERFIPGREITVAVMADRRARRARDPHARHVLRLHREIRRGRLRASHAGADPPERL